MAACTLNAWTILVVLQLNFAKLSQGLSCFTCVDVDAGSIVGYEEDYSCKWGSKPDDNFLQGCDNNNRKNEFDFACAAVKLNGFYNSGGEYFSGTIRGCAARLIGTSSVQILNGTTKNNDVTINASEECQRGSLPTIVHNFKNPTGKEYLQGISAIFKDGTTINFCTCDTDGCWVEESAAAGRGGTSVKFHPLVTLIVFLVSKALKNPCG